MKTMEADLMDLKNINREICRITTVYNAYMEALTIQWKTNHLTESDILPGSTEQSDLDALRVYVDKLDGLVETRRCTELTELYKGLCDRKDLITKRASASVVSRASDSSPSSKPVMTPLPRTPTLTLQMPTFDGTFIGWKGFWSLFSSNIELQL